MSAGSGERVQATAHIPCRSWELVRVRPKTPVNTKLMNLYALCSSGRLWRAMKNLHDFRKVTLFCYVKWKAMGRTTQASCSNVITFGNP